MTKILLISRDPGATNQLVALHHILTGPDCENRKALFARLGLTSCPDIIVIAKDYAGDIWRQNGTCAEQWPGIALEQEIGDYLESKNPGQIITGTCHVDDRTEQAIWRSARRLGIATTAFLDAVHNIDLRFRDKDGAVVLPDRVSLIDGSAVPKMRSLGLPEQAIFVSGDLYLDYSRVRARGHRRRADGPILFASDYIREMQAMGLVFEVNEFDCLDCLIDLVKSGRISEYISDMRPPCHLIIRPHPKDTAGKYDSYPALSDKNITIRVGKDGSATEAILSSCLVAGLGSALLVEARALGVAVLELGPIVRRRKDRGKTVS